MNAKRTYILLLSSVVLGVVALLAGGYLATTVLQNQAKHLADARLQSAVLDAKQHQLLKARSDVAKYKDLAAIAQSIVPQDKDQAQTVREIVSIAAANNIKLGSITFPSSTLGGTASGSSAPAANSSKSQLKPVKNIPGVYSLDITIQSDTLTPAKYDKFLSFLDALEHNRRTAAVSGIALQPDATNPNNLTFTLNLSEYIKP